MLQMHFDALTLACVAAELRRTLLTGRVQQVLAPDEQSIALEIYAQRTRHYVLIHGGGRAARLHLTSQKLRRGVEKPSPLMLLLRKYVRDSLVEQIVQPDPTERVIQLQFRHAQHGSTTLILEVLGQQSNLILLNPAGRILDCLVRVWPGEGVARPLVPGQPYTPPAAQAKLPPLDDGREDYYEQLAQLLRGSGPLWKALVAGVAGISPTLAREVAWRAAGSLEAAADEVELMAVVAALQSLWAPVEDGEWRPGIWRINEQIGGCSPYEAHGRGDFMPTASMSAALEQCYGQAAADSPLQDAYAGLRATVAAQLHRAERRVQRQVAALAGDEPAPGAAEKLRTQAEWLLALHQEIQPGQTELIVPLDEAEPVRIPLEGTRAPIEQAERMFKQAGRLDRAARFIPERRSQLLADLEFLAQLQTDLRHAENQPEIAAVRAELLESNLLPPSQKPPKREPRSGAVSQPHRFLSQEGYEILVGRNARQNERLTFDLARRGDLWLHVRGAPGSHVIIRSGGQSVQEATLRMAGQLAAYYSSQRGEQAAVVSYTQRQNVSRAPGGRPGQVVMRHERTITVPAELP